MSFRLRPSKYRHVFGSAAKKGGCYENLRLTRSAHDSAMCAVNPEFLSVVIDSAGAGSFIVIPLADTGRVDINTPRVCGHAGQVMDIKWNPFHDHIIASAAEDGLVKVWQVPENGLTDHLTEHRVELRGHQRRLSYIEWHPSAADIMLSTGYDHSCIVWSVEAGAPVTTIDVHPDTVYSISWNREGSLFATTCKDKLVRLIDPRTGQVAAQGENHDGPKSAKVCYLNDLENNKLFTTGFTRNSTRQYKVFDIRSLKEALVCEKIDNSSGVTIPIYDPDNRVMFVAGRGDGNIRLFEITNQAPYCTYLNQYPSSEPQRGLGVMPKRGLDVSKNEIMRFYKLSSTKSHIEPLSMIVPRRAQMLGTRSEMFQEDIYPPCAAAVPALKADEWLAGQNSAPALVSLKDQRVLPGKKGVASPAVKPPQENTSMHIPLRKGSTLRKKTNDAPSPASGAGDASQRAAPAGPTSPPAFSAAPARTSAPPTHKPSSHSQKPASQNVACAPPPASQNMAYSQQSPSQNMAYSQQSPSPSLAYAPPLSSSYKPQERSPDTPPPVKLARQSDGGQTEAQTKAREEFVKRDDSCEGERGDDDVTSRQTVAQRIAAAQAAADRILKGDLGPPSPSRYRPQAQEPPSPSHYKPQAQEPPSPSHYRTGVKSPEPTSPKVLTGRRASEFDGPKPFVKASGEPTSPKSFGSPAARGAVSNAAEKSASDVPSSPPYQAFPPAASQYKPPAQVSSQHSAYESSVSSQYKAYENLKQPQEASTVTPPWRDKRPASLRNIEKLSTSSETVQLRKDGESFVDGGADPRSRLSWSPRTSQEALSATSNGVSSAPRAASQPVTMRSTTSISLSQSASGQQGRGSPSPSETGGKRLSWIRSYSDLTTERVNGRTVNEKPAAPKPGPKPTRIVSPKLEAKPTTHTVSSWRSNGGTFFAAVKNEGSSSTSTATTNGKNILNLTLESPVVLNRSRVDEDLSSGQSSPSEVYGTPTGNLSFTLPETSGTSAARSGLQQKHAKKVLISSVCEDTAPPPLPDAAPPPLPDVAPPLPDNAPLDDESGSDDKDSGEGGESDYSAPAPALSELVSGSETVVELRQAYQKQQEEIRSLTEQLHVKDHRIRQLETELQLLKAEGYDGVQVAYAAGDSHC